MKIHKILTSTLAISIINMAGASYATMVEDIGMPTDIDPKAKWHVAGLFAENQNNHNLANVCYNEAEKKGFYDNDEQHSVNRSASKKRRHAQAFSESELNEGLPVVKRQRNEERQPSNIPTNISFQTQVDKFLQRVTQESQMTIDHNHWAVSILVQPEFEQAGSAIIGHSVLALVGRDNNQPHPIFWASDFMADLTKGNPLHVIRAAFDVTQGVIRTTDDPEDRATLLQNVNFSTWRFHTWTLPREEALTLQRRVNAEKLDPPLYNLFGHNIFSFMCRKYTFNCSGWTVDQVRKCNINIPGTLLSRILGISAPGIEHACGHQ